MNFDDYMNDDYLLPEDVLAALARVVQAAYIAELHMKNDPVFMVALTQLEMVLKFNGCAIRQTESEPHTKIVYLPEAA
jgi:hypothetical protein